MGPGYRLASVRRRGRLQQVERFRNWQGTDGTISTIGVELVGDRPGGGTWRRRVYMVAPPTPGLLLRSPTNATDPEWLFAVDLVEALVWDTASEALHFGTYVAYGRLNP